MKKKWLSLFESFIGDIRIVSKEHVSADSRGTPLVLWESQRRFIKEVGTGLDSGIHKFICLKSRQLGVTTVSLAIDLFWMAMHPNIIGCLVTDDEKKRDANRTLLRQYVNSFPDGYFGDDFKLVQDNRSQMRFSNGARLDLLVAGTRDKGISWAEGVGYTLIHCTEVSAYGNPEGLRSLEEGFAQTSPARLMIMESTAKGYNHWRSRYQAALADGVTERAFFTGWWSGDTNRVERKDPRWPVYGTSPAYGEEKEKIELVAKLYGYKISQEQLAWIRWKENDAGAEQELLLQNQPWTADEAFVQTGFSFFPLRMVNADLQALYASGEMFKGYAYEVDGGFFSFRMRALHPDKGDDVEDVELRVWEEPVADGQYVIGMDPAYGRNDNKDRHCLDERTEILTKTGWKNCDEVKVGDEAVCFDIGSGCYSYGVVSDVIHKDYDGDAYFFKSKGLRSLVTADHRVVTRCYAPLRNGDKAAWRVRTAREIADFGRTVLEIPVGKAVAGVGVPNLDTDWCRLLGWVLTDGHIACRRVTGGPREGQKRVRAHIVLGQSIETEKAGVRVAEAMVDVVTRLMPTAYVRRHKAADKRTGWVVIRVGVVDSERITYWLGEERSRIPRGIMEQASLEQLEALFQGILEGDGGWDKQRQEWTKVCPGVDYGFASDVQELALKLGYSATIAPQAPGAKGRQVQYIVRLARRKSHTFEADKVEKQHLKGRVWCVTVPTGAFVARRDGAVFVTGNCISVWRCFADKLVQVAEYATNDVEAKHAAWVLFHLASAYRNCVVNVELQGPGQLVMLEFNHLRELLAMEMNARNVVAKGWEEAGANVRWYLYHRPDSMGAGYMYNFETSWRTKPPLMHGFKGEFVSKAFVIRSIPLLREMANVIVDDGDIGAPESKDEDMKDDRVFGAALAYKAWKDWVQSDMMQQGLTYDVVMSKEQSDMTPAGRIVDNIVHGFLKRQIEEAEEAAEATPPHLVWREERGL